MNTKSIFCGGRGAALGAALATLLLCGPLQAQISLQVRGSGAQFSRADLTELLERYEEAARSPAYSSQVRESAEAGAERIRRRLEEGDFRLGDRIVLTVQNEPNLPDTVAVQSGPLITLPLFGEIDLSGVLRSELEDHLTANLARYINQPVVEAKALTRLSVQGAVGDPNFYVVPADMLLSEALRMAGGPAQAADLQNLRIERGTEVFLEGEEVQAALVEGLTLDQLSLQGGDALVVPAERGGFWGTVRNVTLVVLPIVTLVTLFTR